jgi:hypothetical protein
MAQKSGCRLRWKGFVFCKWQFSENMVALKKIGPEMDSISTKGRPNRVSKELAADLKRLFVMIYARPP